MRPKHFSRAWKQSHRNDVKGITPIYGKHGAKEETNLLHISRADRRKSIKHMDRADRMSIKREMRHQSR